MCACVCRWSAEHTGHTGNSQDAYIYICIYTRVRICICVYTCTCVLHRMLGNVARWLEFPFYQSPQSVPFMCAQAMSASEVHVGVVMYGSDKLVSVVFQTNRR